MERHEKIILAIVIGFAMLWVYAVAQYFISQLPPLPVPHGIEKVKLT